jgi:EF hand
MNRSTALSTSPRVPLAAVALAAALLAAAPPAQAQTAAPAGKEAAEAAFKRADANGDGKLSKEEAARLPEIAARFDELDKDKDGALTLVEYLAGMGAK